MILFSKLMWILLLIIITITGIIILNKLTKSTIMSDISSGPEADVIYAVEFLLALLIGKAGLGAILMIIKILEM